MDKIVVNNLKIFAYHGVNPEEKADGQTFLVDLEATVDLTEPCHSDELENTVSYAKIIKTIRRVMTEQKDNLIERAAQRVADAVLKEFLPIVGVKIMLKKPDAPIKADFDFVAVEIERERGDVQND